MPGSSVENPNALFGMFPYNYDSLDSDNMKWMSCSLAHLFLGRTWLLLQHKPRSHELTCLAELPQMSTAHKSRASAPCVSHKTGRVRGVGGVSDRGRLTDSFVY